METDQGAETSQLKGACGDAPGKNKEVKTEEQPVNGIRGLRYWREDIVAGLIVALVSVPLSLGIALASGAPAIAGLTSEIIAGLIFPFMGGAYVTISGPAAGLAPILFVSITSLGHGDMELGYHRVLAVILIAGILQLVLTACKAAKFSYMLPSAAIHGMLCSIGLLIIAKQIPNFIGEKFHAHEFWGMILETPAHMLKAHLDVFMISSLCLAMLFIIPKVNWKALRFVPAQLVVVVLGIALGQLLHVDKTFLVQIPENPLANCFVMPDFSGVFSDHTVWASALIAVIALTLVDGTESLATIHAVDKIDPFKRKSSPNRTLFAMGISNICSSLIGGLTIIPGIIKSTTCIVSGGKTAWVNFYNALFLIAFLAFAVKWINLIPIGALAAVLMHIGFKLAGPKMWRSVAMVGREQLTVFSVTVMVTLCSDLLVGIVAGVLTKVLILIRYALRARMISRHPQDGDFLGMVLDLFRSPLGYIETKNGTMTLVLSRPLTCFNSLKLRAAIDRADDSIHTMHIIATEGVTLVDHSTSSYLHTLQMDWRTHGRDLDIVGLENLRRKTSDEDCLRYRVAIS